MGPHRRTIRSIVLAFSVCALTLAAPASAAIQASAEVFTNQTSAPFTYTVALHNTGTTPIGTFWFAWTASPATYDFLPTSPTNIVAPSGWIAPISHNAFPGDGYGIEWYNIGGSNIGAGQTVSTFQFTTNDSPAVLAGNAFFPGFKVTHSYVYQGFPLGDPGALFLVTVPEPACASAVLLVGVLRTRRRTRRAT